jgi:PAS domain-containing protein
VSVLSFLANAPLDPSANEPSLDALLGVYHANGADELLEVNETFAHICGYEHSRDFREHVTGIGSDLSVDPKRRTEFLRRLQEKGEVRAFESSIRRRDGFLVRWRKSATAGSSLLVGPPAASSCCSWQLAPVCPGW